LNPSKIFQSAIKKVPGGRDLYTFLKCRSYLLLELLLELLFEEELLFLEAPFEDDEAPFLAALFVAPPFEDAFEEVLPFLAAPFEAVLEVDFEEVLPFLAAPLAAPFDAVFEELFAAPFEALLPAAFFAVAMLF
jgi:hypothetical protein